MAFIADKQGVSQHRGQDELMRNDVISLLGKEGLHVRVVSVILPRGVGRQVSTVDDLDFLDRGLFVSKRLSSAFFFDTDGVVMFANRTVVPVVPEILVVFFIDAYALNSGELCFAKDVRKHWSIHSVYVVVVASNAERVGNEIVERVKEVYQLFNWNDKGLQEGPKENYEIGDNDCSAIPLVRVYVRRTVEDF